MENPDQDQQDPRSVPGVEDTTAMTIEFLRARLLSERSVSRSARQRADELAKRVAELEEQLKVVSLQRKMAEKATADVLSILEDNGASDISETLDSNSDHETPCESKVEGADVNSNSTRRRNVHEEYSSSDIDTSPVLSGSLSWKGRNDSPHTHEKYKKISLRSRSSFTSIDSSSPKHRLGRSCRQIKRRDPRPLNKEQELKSEALVDSSQEIAPSTCSEDSRKCCINGQKILGDGHELHEETRSGSSPDHDSVGNKDQDHDLDGYEKVSDMEKALECQAQLIDQYEAMEKAQREWEEKFRENNNSTPDSCDPGNHSDITEERDEIRAQAPNLSGNAFNEIEAKSQVAVDCILRDSSQAQTNGLGPSSCADVEELQDQNSNSISTSRSLEEFTFPMANVKQCQESQENREQEPPCTSQLNYGLPERPLSSHGGIKFHDQETPCSKNDLYALVPHEPPALNGVLEALKQAKLSLAKKINKLPSAEGESIGKSIGTLSVPNVGGRLEVPIGCAGLFRLPTDFAAEASSQANFLSSSSQSRSGSHYPGEGGTLSTNLQFFPSHEREDRSSFFTSHEREDRSSFFPSHEREDRSSFFPSNERENRSSFLRDNRLRNSGYGFPTDHFPENGWNNPSQGQRYRFDRNFDTTQPSPHVVHEYPPPPVSSSIHPNESLLRTFPSRSIEMPPANQYSYYDDQYRPNMYR